MSEELSVRFGHLLQPIRDLTKNWDIDVAAQLEEYLEEIEQITIAFDGQNNTMNFAEAALLIQGSTCVYSKKVEYLYSLVYQTLDLIASKKKLTQPSSVDDQGKDRDVSFAQKNDEFLTLDMVEAHNIDMDERPSKELKTGTCQVVPRTPMSLIPLQDTERASSTPLLSRKGEVLGSRMDFMMNTGAMHSSGALLLEPVNHLMLTAKVTDRGAPGPHPAGNSPLRKTTGAGSDGVVPSMVQNDNDAHLFEEGDDDGYAGDADNMEEDFNGGEDNHHNTSKTALSRQKDRGGRSLRRVHIHEEEELVDPWALLDPHKKSSTENKPLRKGVTYKIPPCLLKSESRKRKKKSAISGGSAEPLTAFLRRTVYSCSSVFPKNPLKAPSSSEFEGFYWAEAKRRIQQKKQENLKLVQMRRDHALHMEQQALREEEADQDDLDDYQPLGGSEDEGGVVLDNMEAGFQGALDNYAYGNENGRGTDPQEHLAALAGFGSSTFQGVEPMALDELSGNARDHRPVTYEDLVKNYVEGTIEGVQTYMQETDLTKRVEQWEDKIKPILAVEEDYPMFDIHAYGSTVIQELQQKENVVKFSALAKDKWHYDVSRLFAASLQLANNYNLEISSEGVGEDAVDTMTLTLLNPEPLHTQLSSCKALTPASNSNGK